MVLPQIEESYISADSLAIKVGQDPSIILKSEVAVLQGLGFDLITHSPLRALAGLIQVCVTHACVCVCDSYMCV